jgi:hypothetical protein
LRWRGVSLVMEVRMTQRTYACLVAAAIASGMATAADGNRLQAFADSWRATMTINNPIADTSQTASGVLSDALGSTYVDYQLPSGDFCFSGEAYSHGLAFMSLNRRLANGLLCHGQLDDDNQIASSRSYQLQISSSQACNELGFAAQSSCLVTPDADGVTLVRAETLFKSKAKATKVVFLFTTNFKNYRVETNVDAPITGGPDTKTATNYGLMSLRLVGRTQAIASFPLPFQLVFVRQ